MMWSAKEKFDFLRQHMLSQAEDSYEHDVATSEKKRGKYREQVIRFTSTVEAEFENNNIDGMVEYVGKPDDHTSDMIRIACIINEQLAKNDNVDNLMSFFVQLMSSTDLLPYFSTEFITSGHEELEEGDRVVILVLRHNHSWSEFEKTMDHYIDLSNDEDGGAGRRF